MKTKQDIIPSRLRELRTSHEMSMAQFSEAIGGCLSDSRIATIETGKATLPIQYAIEICNTFGCDLNWLYYQENAKAPDFLAPYTVEDLKFVKEVIDKILSERK